MKSTLREVLADSHVSALAIAVPLLWSLDAGSKALWILLCRAATVLLMRLRSLTFLTFLLNSLSQTASF